jgi:phosphatidylserine/phosphatidylglycerophosphate/cardiolipin synthase-like enzyme
MRYRSPLSDGLQVFAVAGTNTVSFGIHADQAARSGLLGFAIERIDPAKDERYYLHGFKVFPSIVPEPDQATYVSTYVHPIQSLVWDDFTAEPGHDYTYVFHPLAGTPKKLDRSRASVSIDITTERLKGETHDVFFNRGVASSQAYARTFLNLSPTDQPSQSKRRRALQWLSRDLDEAMLAFVRDARNGDAIRGCFYEFSYGPVLAELAEAISRGVDVKLVVDCKVNEHTVNEKQPDGTTKPVFYKSSPRLKNLAAITDAALPPTAIIPREARRSAIAHNKFMVLLTGNPLAPEQVWTGSTNLTEGGIHGQANVGHWIRDATTAAKFHAYWELLATDPGGRQGDTQSVVRARNSEFYTSVDVLSPTPARDAIPPGITPLFSPRSGSLPLQLYVTLLDEADDLACITFAFTVPDLFKAALKQNTSDGPLCFLLLEKEDRPAQNSTKPFIRLNAENNVYMASGAELRTTLGRWVVETDTRKLGLNQHVAFIHCKFLLHDPLGDDPIVVTGSANFSAASTSENDENMVIVRGDRRVADIYFTEFNRLFNHYYFRSIAERSNPTETLRGLHLAENDSWLDKYSPGTLRSKRVECFVQMAL